MVNEIPEHIWFIRDSRRGFYPVNPKAWRLVFRAAKIVVACFAIGLICAVLVNPMLGLGLFVVGIAATAWWFIATARVHGDFSGRYSPGSDRAVGKSAAGEG
jgi:hypothetical protein